MPTSAVLADALGYDPRIGRQCLNAGLGFGGGCLPKDIRAFMARAGELGADQALTFLREVDSINMRRRTRMVELATTACGGSLLGANIAVLGAAFKPESDDVRDSPALNVAGQLQLNGAAVNVYDPKALDNAQPAVPDAELRGFGRRGLRARRRGAGADRVAASSSTSTPTTSPTGCGPGSSSTVATASMSPAGSRRAGGCSGSARDGLSGPLHRPLRACAESPTMTIDRGPLSRSLRLVLRRKSCVNEMKIA